MIGDAPKEAAARPHETFETVYRTHAPWVLLLSRRLTGNAADAEDVTQQVFIQIWHRQHQYSGASALRTWIHRITVNAAIQHLRQRKRAARREEIAMCTQPDRQVPAGDAAIDLERAIARLPDAAREVFVLREIEGLSYDAIARWTGLAIGTVKSQLHRARALIREELQ